MTRTLELNGIGTAVVFSNNVCVVNTTPHPITMQDTDGTLVEVPTSVLVNATPVEKRVDDLFVKTIFMALPEYREALDSIEEAFTKSGSDARLVVVGSIIAAQAYPGRVAGLCPVPGYERVAPAEKRMRCDKFTIFSK